MLRVSVDELKPGMVLARPIPLPDQPRRVLLARNFKISEAMIPKLREAGISTVWIRFQGMEFLESVIDEELQQQQRQVYSTVRHNFERMMGGAEPDLDFPEFSKGVSELFEYLKGSPSGTVMLEKLDAFDNYLMSHTVNVCYLALLLGMKLDDYLIQERRAVEASQAKDLQELGLGCLLHDVGKMQVPRAILDKPGRLTAEERDEMRRHPAYGYAMVRDQVSAPVAQIVLNHHQRWDGNGYPRPSDRRTGQPLEPLAGNRIPVFCRMTTPADVYDAATSARIYSPPKPPVQVLHEMRTVCRGSFDPMVEKAFFEIVPPFPIASLVTLSTGDQAVVVEHNRHDSCRPRVKLLRDPSGALYAGDRRQEIDLSAYPELHVTHWGGHDVRPFLFSSDRTTPVPWPGRQSADESSALAGNRFA
jgi:HD-GYP domain-containing protein (c-di-GMP phosphodiesterase class II)